jgi:hypothetical protein
MVVKNGMDNIGNDHSSLATNRWYRRQSGSPAKVLKVAGVDRHHVLDAA